MTPLESLFALFVAFVVVEAAAVVAAVHLVVADPPEIKVDDLV